MKLQFIALFFTLKLCGKYVSKKNALLKEYYFINIHKTNYNTKHYMKFDSINLRIYANYFFLLYCNFKYQSFSFLLLTCLIPH